MTEIEIETNQVDRFRQLRADKVVQRQDDLEGVGHLDVVVRLRLVQHVDLVRAGKKKKRESEQRVGLSSGGSTVVEHTPVEQNS